MADRNEVIKRLESYNKMFKDQAFIDYSLTDAIDGAIELLKEQPQIVRCKDCKKRNTIHCPVRNTVTNIDKRFADNWFCADGERAVT